ncbi:hypothetical protein A3740_04910 [Oleiphilus sp. HI0068]|jgi:membrane associated rhomboid family serine protease|uniref:rhomboid family intramembrane serine protease n=1 Tax=unclassified Oleiphilus TaxID=2631174 RepID=UPI0007C2E55F|nr:MULTISPECIES: rhomboid family intramembrane serine protease [unclassified Oleiphilus]KZY83926.1 hypothetical protein A3740_04910 [Oleiphilus sp. HI0068]KZY85322.1 hypothetical protein A3741_02910 [Oleiphilus sp. HI0069]KZZ46802.1 hypothetical protein A3755_02650 [Oleiphilus sp. HI0085]KZY59834.1 hypothetical protein A3735_02080 [Oleiphilus sp. HI0061]KZZ80452.1 hypothetical protein A3766_08690 [Oleiphilus sp. HI0132]
MSIKKTPFLTLLLSLTLLISVLYGHKHDEQQWLSINKHYQQDLLAIEAPIFFDYLDRRLNIEGLGSAQKIDSLKADFEDGESLPTIKAILEDSAFSSYIKQNGSMFLEKAILETWHEERLIIEQMYRATSTNLLGLSAQDFSIRQILTHVFAHPSHPLFILVFLCFSVLSFYFEKRFGAFKLYCYFLFSMFISSLTYLLFTTKSNAVLVGPLGAIYGLASPLVLDKLKNFQAKRESLQPSKSALFMLLMLTLSLITYTVLHTLDQPRPSIYLLASMLLPALSTGIFMSLSMKVAAKETPKNKPRITASVDWEYRAELSKAMEFLSRFEFNTARQLLRSLGAKYPESRAILEQRYNLAKLHTEDSSYWKHAQNLIELCVRKSDYERMCRLFSDIQKNAASKKRAQECLQPEHYHKMMMLFIKHGDLPKAEQAFLFLELAGNQHITQDACLLLIQEFKIRHTAAKQQQYEMLLERLKA